MKRRIRARFERNEGLFAKTQALSALPRVKLADGSGTIWTVRAFGRAGTIGTIEPHSYPHEVDRRLASVGLATQPPGSRRLCGTCHGRWRSIEHGRFRSHPADARSRARQFELSRLARRRAVRGTLFLAGEPRILRMLPVILATAHLWFEQEPCLSRLAENEIEDRRGEDRDPRVPHDEDPEIPLHAATMERRSGARYLSSRTMLSAQRSPRLRRSRSGSRAGGRRS